VRFVKEKKQLKQVVAEVEQVAMHRYDVCMQLIED
jgi:hypothetical protein